MPQDAPQAAIDQLTKDGVLRAGINMANGLLVTGKAANGDPQGVSPDLARAIAEALGEVPLMITKHCVRWSLSLCPKQAKGVTGVQGTVRAEPLTLTHGEDRLTLRFDCKPCEMHVVGAMRKNVLKALKAEPLTFYRTRPSAGAGAPSASAG